MLNKMNTTNLLIRFILAFILIVSSIMFKNYIFSIGETTEGVNYTGFALLFFFVILAGLAFFATSSFLSYGIKYLVYYLKQKNNS